MVNKAILIVSDELAFLVAENATTCKMFELISVQTYMDIRCNVRVNKNLLRKYNRQTLLSMLRAGEICVIVLPFVG